jgi:uncharacterized protein (DUF58 family)
VERTQKVYVIIDASRLSARYASISEPDPETKADRPESETPPVTIFDRYITAALVVGMALERHGDMFGVLAFSNRVIRFVSAKSGKNHYGACRDALYTLEPEATSPDFEELFTFIGTRIRQRSLLIFLTCLDDPVIAESFTDHISLVSKRHLVLVNVLKPEIAGPIFSKGEVNSVDDIYERLGGHMIYNRLEESKKMLKRHNAFLHYLENEKMSAQLVSRYLAVKQRQAL